MIAAVLFLAAFAHAMTQIIVSSDGPITTLTAALVLAKPGDTITVKPGMYREPTIVVRTPRVVIRGEEWPRFDGEGKRTVMIVEADSVTVTGLVLANTGTSQMEDRAAVRVRNAYGCRILGNRLEHNLFGIYLERASGCVISDNDISASGTSQTLSGNGIHLWYAPNTVVERNRIRGQRDGIYFEFSQHGITRNNVSEQNQRYGLHFMYSDSCRYEANTFLANHSGVAVMYSRSITISGNTFERAVGAASYGLLLKEILGGTISGNRFTDNSTGLYLEGSQRLDVSRNRFIRNGWAARIMADARDNAFNANVFAGNAFDVGTNSGTTNSTFAGNWWDQYRGYDLNRDGIGDVPFRPVRLFGMIVEQHPEALALLRSPLVALLDAAERVMPVLTPAALADTRPLMMVPR